jgi:tRNA U55 pseudouridine synthase TruB
VELSKLDKTYEVTMKLGEVSSTGDSEGEITPNHPPRRPEFSSGPPTKKGMQYQEEDGILKQVQHDAGFADEEGEKTVVSDTIPTQKAVLEALERLQGPIMQVPPAYSAMKINGQRAYKLAREGKTVELEARPVTIYSSELTSYDYPFVKFTSRVSTGTYIRSLVVDLGEILGTGAYMSDLKRTSIADFSLEKALQVEGLSAEIINDNIQNL